MTKMEESNCDYLHNDYGYNTTDNQKQERHYAFIGSHLRQERIKDYKFG